MTGVVVSCSYSFDSTTDHLHDFVNGTGQDTNAANKLPALDRLEAGREKLAGRRGARQLCRPGSAGQGGRRQRCLPSGWSETRDRDRPGPSELRQREEREREGDNLTRGRGRPPARAGS